jgi:putative phosphoserine phosphatase / 1-acylglycerol-3-phosphate O-acyltransferase
MKKIIIFDLDGTLIRGQSQKLLVKYAYRRGLINFSTLFKIFLWFSLYKIGIKKDPRKIMEFGYSFLANKRIGYFEKFFDDFFKNELRNYIYKEAVEIINGYKEESVEMVIVSNSIKEILSRVARFFAIDNYFGTELEKRHGRFTGRIKNGIIYGKNKLELLDGFIVNEGLSFKNSIVLSDHHSDRFLLEKSSCPIAVNPTLKLRKIAQKYNWKILTFKETIKNEF